MTARSDFNIYSLDKMHDILIQIIGSLMILIFLGSPIIADESVQFQNYILPIFKQHCFECHAGEDIEGDLHLNSVNAIRRGGHSGLPMLSQTPEASELYRRLLSHEENYRMPPDGPTLASAELESIRDWISIASWHVASSPPSLPDQNSPTSLIDLIGRTLNQLSAAQANFGFRITTYCGLILLCYLAYWIVTFFRIYLKKRAQAKPTLLRHFHFRSKSHLVFLLVLISITCLSYLFGVIENLNTTNQQLTDKLARYYDDPSGVTNSETPKAPEFPMHPKRLGGVYFRGNDERSPQLFNGGFYRTATIEVWLTDTHGNRLNWHSTNPDGPLFVSLMIQRAPQTTRALFDQRVMGSVFLQHAANDNLQTDAAIKVPLQTLIPGEKWIAQVPIDEDFLQQNGQIRGTIHLHYGGKISDNQPGRIHYGIKYDVQLSQNQISPESELWIGSMYHLNGRVLLPDKDHVLLDRWFDFRPIPEIEGENSSDPVLLGIPEHFPRE